MSLERSISDRLLANAGIAALVGTHIYPLLAPLAAPIPYLVYQIIDEERHPTWAGSSGVVTARVQIVAVDNDSVGALNLAEAVRDSLDGYSGAMGSVGSTTAVGVCNMTGRGESYSGPNDGSDIPLFVRRMEFTVGYRETVPTLA